MAQPILNFLEEHRAAVDALLRRAAMVHEEALNEKARMDALMPSFYPATRYERDH